MSCVRTTALLSFPGMTAGAVRQCSPFLRHHIFVISVHGSPSVTSPPTGSTCVSVGGLPSRRHRLPGAPVCEYTGSWAGQETDPYTALCLASDWRVRDFHSSSLSPGPQCDPHSSPQTSWGGLSNLANKNTRH